MVGEKSKGEHVTYFTVKEVAAMWKCGEDAVFNAIQSGRLMAFRLDPTRRKSPWRISEDALKEHERLCCGRKADRKKQGRRPKLPEVKQYF